MIRISRRGFLNLSLGGFAAVAQIKPIDCGRLLKPPQEEPVDIVLEGDAKSAAKKVAGKFDTLLDVVKNPGKKLRVGVKGDDGKTRVVTFRMRQDEKVAKYPFLNIEEGGNQAALLWGIEDFLPSLKFADQKGNTLRKNNEPLEFGLRDVLKSLKEKGKQLKELDLSGRDILELGVAAAAIGFAAWLTFSVGKAIIAALSFIAFNLMVLGIVVAGVLVLGPILKRVLERLDLDAIKSFASESADRIERVLGEAIALL